MPKNHDICRLVDLIFEYLLCILWDLRWIGFKLSGFVGAFLAIRWDVIRNDLLNAARVITSIAVHSLREHSSVTLDRRTGRDCLPKILKMSINCIEFTRVFGHQKTISFENANVNTELFAKHLIKHRVESSGNGSSHWLSEMTPFTHCRFGKPESVYGRHLGVSSYHRRCVEFLIKRRIQTNRFESSWIA